VASTVSVSQALDFAAQNLARAYPGPGGACAVLHEGRPLLRHAWGFANAERRIAFTPRSQFRLCSVTKQFTCAVLLEEFPDPSILDEQVRARLPLLGAAAPSTLHLCHNQSGLRDYWAVAMLHGSPVEAPFGESEARRLIAATRSLQFAPGTRYSYANQNFRLLADVVSDRTERHFDELLRRRVFEPAGMETAFLAADTRALPDGSEGYEAMAQGGFRAAENRILWTGDAGLAACLDDMIAWERHIDATRDDPGSLYRRLSAPVTFADGGAAAYGFGLSRRGELGIATSGHGGALRGWRSHRLYAPSERISVVVMFNHLNDAHSAAIDLLAAVRGVDRPRPRTDLEPPAWLGLYVDPETGLSVRTDPLTEGQVRLRFGHSSERLDLMPDGSAQSDVTRLSAGDGGVWMERRAENQRSLLRPVAAAGGAGTAPASSITGRYWCAELDSGLDIIEAGGVLCGGFCGFLGQGRMETLEPLGSDLLALPCPRALDHTPPGDWTIALTRDAGGRVDGAVVGCWLARGLRYARCD
jgi:D-aminopeptidase